MTTVLQQHTDIPASATAVYDYVTRPVRWKEWHASSLTVQGVGDESLVAGRRFEEDIAAAGGLQRHLTWLVEEAKPAQRWRASAYMADGSTVRVTYDIEETGSGVRFTRTLEYAIAPVFLRWLNALFLQARVEKESARALEKLRGQFVR